MAGAQGHAIYGRSEGSSPTGADHRATYLYSADPEDPDQDAVMGTSKNSCFWAARCDFEVRGRGLRVLPGVRFQGASWIALATECLRQRWAPASSWSCASLPLCGRGC